MDISNTCTITVKNSGETFKGQLDNISANGFALLVKDPFFASAKGRDISIAIDNFALTAHSVLEGRIIRSSENEGTYIVGCQMPEDNYYIMEYVESALRENPETCVKYKITTIKQLEPNATVTEGLSVMQNEVTGSASDIAAISAGPPWYRTGSKCLSFP